MLSHLLVIITCISMVGMTVVPASAIPCCCNRSLHAREVSHSRAEVIPPVCCPERDTKVHSCCRAKLQTACRSDNFVKQKCPRCRCLEQLQIVALSGYASTESNTRVSPAIVPTVTPMPFTGLDESAVGTALSDCRDPIVILQTCTLRC